MAAVVEVEGGGARFGGCLVVSDAMVLLVEGYLAASASCTHSVLLVVVVCHTRIVITLARCVVLDDVKLGFGLVRNCIPFIVDIWQEVRHF